MYGLNRYLCDVFEEMRTTTKSMNFSILLSLIEEAQMMANRMEMRLEDQNDYENLRNDISDKKKELKKLLKTIAKKKETIEEN